MSVTLQIKLNGGAPQTGGVTGAIGDVVQLTAANKSTWSGAARWEICDYPVTFSAPAGWSTDGDGTIYVVGNADPGPFTIAADEWSKFGFRLTATDGGVVTTDESTALCVPHPTTGVRGIFAGESTQFGGERERWVKDMKADVRALVAALASPTYTSLTLDDGTDTLSLAPGTTANITANKSLKLSSGTATGDITLDSANDIDLDVTGPTGFIRAKLESVTKFQAEVSASTVELNGAAGVAVSLYSADNLGLASDVDVVVTAGQFFYATSVDNAEVTSTTQSVVLSGETGVVMNANGVIAALTESAGALTLAPQNASLRIEPTQSSSGAGKDVAIGGGQGAASNTGGKVILAMGEPGSGSTTHGDIEFHSGTGVKLGYLSRYAGGNELQVHGTGTLALGGAGTSTTLLNPSTTAQISTALMNIAASTGLIFGNGTNAGFLIARCGTSGLINSATTTNVLTYASSSGFVYHFFVFVTVSNDTDNEGATYLLYAAFKNVAGTMTQIGTTDVIASKEDAGQTGLSATIDFSGTTPRVRLTTDSGDSVYADAVALICQRALA